MKDAWEGLPGHELVSAGLADLAAGRESEASLVVTMAAPRLRALGFEVPGGGGGQNVEGESGRQGAASQGAARQAAARLSRAAASQAAASQAAASQAAARQAAARQAA